MELTILAFGIAREIVGGASTTIKVEAPSLTVAEMKRLLKERFPGFQQLTSLAVAVNSEYASDEQPLGEGDEIVLIPPVSGG